MKQEIHLFILWDKVGTSRDTVLHRIRDNFEILRVFRIQWSPSLFSQNLSRFYRQNLPPSCNKEKSCGTGPFILVVVRDTQPNYALRETTHGLASVNTHTFDFKMYYRSTEGGCLPIHATDTPRETANDLAMLLGFGYESFEKVHPGPWDGKVIALRQDVVGARGWESINALFTVLNETINYVVLRNFECLPHQYHLESHDDIDLLVDNFTNACLITNATPVFQEPYRVHQTVTVAGQAVPFDFRYVGDGYYDERWQCRILESRILKDGGFFIPDVENYFYSLLYHAAIHKPAISSDYITRIINLGKALNIQIRSSIFEDPRKLREFLFRYLNYHGYSFSRPIDPTVYFNTTIAYNSFERFAHRILPKKRQNPLNLPTGHQINPDTVIATRISRILAGLRQCRDVSSYSCEVQALILDTQSEYLLSPARANLLKSFTFGPELHVLELDCGCGAITRVLGETGAKILAIEGDPIKAACAAERCRDLPNVRVYCDNIADFITEYRFDFVTLIGALEYTSCLGMVDDPVGHVLSLARKWLKDDGALILAIENQLGLKYFNGCAEDHTGIPYFGINDLYGPETAVTFGRRELERLIKNAGFKSPQFFYLFPDYKLPGVIISEAGLADERLNVSDLLINNTGKDQLGSRHTAFAEDLAWRTVVKNHLLADLANSFLVLARLDVSHKTVNWLAKMFSRGRRHPCYQVESTIETDSLSNLVVRKRKIFPIVQTKDEWLHHIVADNAYLEGNLLVRKIHQAMAREAGIDELASCFLPWLSFLLANATQNDKGDTLLPGDFVDCIPANLIENSTGQLQYFDREWVSKEPIPIVWTVIRGIAYSLIACLENPCLKKMTYRQFITKIAQTAGFQLLEKDFVIANQYENQLITQCHANAKKIPSLSDFIDNPLFLSFKLSSLSEVRRALTWHEAELARVKSTISWQITKPLRATWNVLQRLKK